MIPDSLKNVKLLGEYFHHKQQLAIVRHCQISVDTLHSSRVRMLKCLSSELFEADEGQQAGGQAGRLLGPGEEGEGEEGRDQGAVRPHRQHRPGNVVIMKITDNNSMKDYWDLSKELVADFKEVFMLFDKDEDGVLTFNELQQESTSRVNFAIKQVYWVQVMQALGQRPDTRDLLQMVRKVKIPFISFFSTLLILGW